MTRAADRVKALVERAAYAVSEWLFNPKCPFCCERRPNLEAHFAVDHVTETEATR